jgi:hypothetical protein
MPPRTPEQIRASIEENRKELGVSLERLRGEVAELTDWRKQLLRYEREAVIGFVIGGGIAAVGGVVFGGRRCRRRRRR